MQLQNHSFPIFFHSAFYTILRGKGVYSIFINYFLTPDTKNLTEII